MASSAEAPALGPLILDVGARLTKVGRVGEPRPLDVFPTREWPRRGVTVPAGTAHRPASPSDQPAASLDVELLQQHYGRAVVLAPSHDAPLTAADAAMTHERRQDAAENGGSRRSQNQPQSANRWWERVMRRAATTTSFRDEHVVVLVHAAFAEHARLGILRCLEGLGVRHIDVYAAAPYALNLSCRDSGVVVDVGVTGTRCDVVHRGHVVGRQSTCRGFASVLARLRRRLQTTAAECEDILVQRGHCSPPSTAAWHAALRAAGKETTPLPNDTARPEDEINAAVGYAVDALFEQHDDEGDERLSTAARGGSNIVETGLAPPLLLGVAIQEVVADAIVSASMRLDRAEMAAALSTLCVWGSLSDAPNVRPRILVESIVALADRESTETAVKFFAACSLDSPAPYVAGCAAVAGASLCAASLFAARASSRPQPPAGGAAARRPFGEAKGLR